MELNLNKGEVCLLIALCEAAGILTTDKDKFVEIANTLRKDIGAI